MNLSECGTKEPEEVERDEPRPCYFCRGDGWIWSDGRKVTCPRCHGKGEED